MRYVRLFSNFFLKVCYLLFDARMNVFEITIDWLMEAVVILTRGHVNKIASS